MLTLTEGAAALRKAIDEMDISDAAAARLANVSGPTMHDWLTGAKRPRLERRMWLQHVFGVRADLWMTDAERDIAAGISTPRAA